MKGLVIWVPLACVVWSNRQATVAQIAEEVNAGSDRKVSEYTVNHSVLRVWWITFSFTSHGWLGACASLTSGTHGTRMQCGKKASLQRQCDALGNVLPGNLGSCHPCGRYFDTYHLPALLQTMYTLSWKWYGCGLFQWENAFLLSATKQKWFRNSLTSTTTSLRYWLAGWHQSEACQLLGTPGTQGK